MAPAARSGAPRPPIAPKKGGSILFGSQLFKQVNPKYVLVLVAVLWASAYGVEWYRDKVIGQSIRVDVESVIDGDTFVGKIPTITYFYYPVRARFRLRAIDAPERTQLYGAEATLDLQELIHPQGGLAPDTEVICRVWGKDPWGRYVVDVVVRQGLYSKVLNVQKEMVRRGAAWSFPNFSRGQTSASDPEGKDSLDALMEDARESKRGLWASDITQEPPWLHRQRQRNTKQGATPSRSPQWEPPGKPSPGEREYASMKERETGRGRNPFASDRQRRGQRTTRH